MKIRHIGLWGNVCTANRKQTSFVIDNYELPDKQLVWFYIPMPRENSVVSDRRWAMTVHALNTDICQALHIHKTC